MARDPLIRRSLTELALEQGGYFTTKQAEALGYGSPLLAYHARQGNFVPVLRGIYRFPELPFDDRDDLIRLSLWSRGRDDVPVAVASHETALSIHDMSEVLPVSIRLTVPPGFRKVGPAGCILHTARLAPRDIEERAGYRVTTPLRTLLDAAAGEVTTEQLEKAVRDALRRGLVSRAALVAAVGKRRHRRLVRILSQG